MATPYERALIQHLVLPDSLRVLVEEDLPDEMFPSEELRPVYRFAIDYWHGDPAESTCPSVDAVLLHFSSVLSEHEIDLTIEPEDTLDWAVTALKGAYIDRKWQPFVLDFSRKMQESTLIDKQAILDTSISELMSLQSSLFRSSERADLRTAMDRQLALYQDRVDLRASGQVQGLIFGMGLVDQHTAGIRAGELAVAAAGPKVGKSWALAWAAWNYWLAGGCPVLFTLENSVEMTLDRIACMVTAVDSRRWQRGECSDEEVERVRQWRDWLAGQERPFHVLQPEPGKRTIEQMVRRAKVEGDAVLIDQLTFVEVPRSAERKPRDQQVRDILHEGKALISSGVRIPCLIAHQINREGVKAAERTGRLAMYHLAESAEVERTADWVFGFWQSRALREVGRLWLQMLAARREDLVHWECAWRPWMGQVQSLAQIQLPED